MWHMVTEEMPPHFYYMPDMANAWGGCVHHLIRADVGGQVVQFYGGLKVVVRMFVTAGNLFCGPTPTKYQVFICQQFRLGCTTTGAFPPLCPALPPVQVPAPQTGSESLFPPKRF